VASIRLMSQPLTRKIVSLIVTGGAAVWMTSAPMAADARSDAREQVEFGINVAQRGLWREAIYRWEKAVELDPKYAAAFNDLAIAYEHEGQLDKARKAYEKALALDPNNANIRQNYDLFKEINDRAAQPKEK
jgi:Tfp pilus assembly protein PilF